MKHLKIFEAFGPENETPSDEETIEFMRKEMEVLKGKIFVGFVHNIYGPLRNLNFYFVDIDPVELHKWFRSFIDKSNRGEADPIILEIWQNTMLVTQPMVLPGEMAWTAEKVPVELYSTVDAENHIKKIIKQNDPKASKDPFYYRRGIV
jgi:hypothetical protein